MLETINEVLSKIDGIVWGVPLMVLILSGGLYLTIRMGFLQTRKLPLALKWMVKNEEDGHGEVTSFGALCTALSATIGTGNIVGVATAICAGGPGALFWMEIAAFLGMATKYAEGLLAVKYRVVDEEGHALGGPFYYIERGMGSKWKWLAMIFAFFGICVGLFGIGTFSQVNGIASAVNNFFDPEPAAHRCNPGNRNLFLDSCHCIISTQYLRGTGFDRRDQTYCKCVAGCCTVYGDHLCSDQSDTDHLQYYRDPGSNRNSSKRSIQSVSSYGWRSGNTVYRNAERCGKRNFL